MKLHVINTGTFKLDGGATFGVVPKIIWQKIYKPDENNFCTWALRCLLIETEDRKILVDCGIGDKQDEKYLKNFQIENYRNFDFKLSEIGFTPDDITDVIFTHLHFDHCGGAVKHNADRTGFEPVFKNAIHWVSRLQWDLANNPNPRERASFLKENFVPLKDHGLIKLIENDSTIYKDITLKLISGHTDGQIIPYINYKGKTLVYMADFIPTAFHFPLPYIASYDTNPLISMAKKEKFLTEALENNYTLYFEHDIFHECCTLVKTEKGIRADKTFMLDTFL
jgi:glyoxylase-like metal-dependent hydrolase (beta-lactamase superfamily II)